MLDTLPEDSVVPHVVQYLNFDDVMHLKGISFSDDIILQYMKWTDFDEPLRYIFKDFKSVNGPGRLQKLKDLMQNVDFNSKLTFWGSVLVACMDSVVVTWENDEALCLWEYDEIRFLWQTTTDDTPAKKYIRSKRGNEAELKQLIERGSTWRRENGEDEYVPTLPPGIIDIFSQLITKCDQESLLLFEQLRSNQVLRTYFDRDFNSWVFADRIAETCRTGGQPTVFLEAVLNSYAVDQIICAAVSHDRFDILDGLLKLFDPYNFRSAFNQTLSEMLRKGRSVPGYDYQFLKDLLTNYMDAIKNAPHFGSIELDEFEFRDIMLGTRYPDHLVDSLMQEDPTPQLESLFSFMMEQFQSNGIQIDREIPAGSALGSNGY